LQQARHNRSHKPRESKIRPRLGIVAYALPLSLRAAAELQRRLQCHWRRDSSKETQAESGCNAFHRRGLSGMQTVALMLIFVVRQLFESSAQKNACQI